MAEESELQYKDISELKKELESMKGRKDISARDLYQSVQKLSQTMSDMLEVFGAAAEQMKEEEKEYGAEAKKHELILSKLDKIIEQNKTIAEGMVSVVDLVKEKMISKEEPKPEPKPRPMEWRPKQEFRRPEFKPRQPMQPSMMEQSSQPAQQSFNPTSFTPTLNQSSFAQAPPPIAPNLAPPDFGMPSLQPAPEPDLDLGLPEEPLPLEEEPKKKGLFGMFKK